MYQILHIGIGKGTLTGATGNFKRFASSASARPQTKRAKELLVPIYCGPPSDKNKREGGEEKLDGGRKETSLKNN